MSKQTAHKASLSICYCVCELASDEFEYEWEACLDARENPTCKYMYIYNVVVCTEMIYGHRDLEWPRNPRTMQRCPACGFSPNDETVQAPKWEKVLYKEQPFEDNHVDKETFLNSMVTNGENYC